MVDEKTMIWTILLRLGILLYIALCIKGFIFMVSDESPMPSLTATLKAQRPELEKAIMVLSFIAVILTSLFYPFIELYALVRKLTKAK